MSITPDDQAFANVPWWMMAIPTRLLRRVEQHATRNGQGMLHPSSRERTRLVTMRAELKRRTWRR